MPDLELDLMINRVFITTLALLSAVATSARAADAPSTAPASVPATTQAAEDSDIEVQEWLILLCDPTQSQANARAIFNNTLPEFIGTRRPFAPEKERNEPRPIGVIRLIGPANPALHTDVLLEMKGGAFIGHWPKTQPRVNRLLWRNLSLTEKPPVLSPIAESHWLHPLRQGASAYLASDRGNDRFLLYDVELPYKAPVKLSAHEKDAATYRLANTGGAPLHDVSIYRPQGEGWNVGTLKEVAASRATTKPTTATTGSTTRRAVTLPEQAQERAAESGPQGQVGPFASASAREAAEAGAPSTGPATTTASTQASTQPASQPIGIEVKMAAVSTEQLLEPWKQQMTGAGLAATDHELILSILRKQLNPRHATIIYRLDPGELDRLLPIEVVPAPKKITRVALVIVRNVDPALTDEIDSLITQLGDAEWTRREQAFKDLAAFGAAAQPKLNAALKHKDVEIVFRAERLLAQLSKPAAPPP